MVSNRNMMSKIFAGCGHIWMLVLITSCQEEALRQNAVAKVNPERNVHACTTAKDTMLDHGDYIKYVPIDSLFGVVIRWKDIVDTMKFRFDCNVTNNLIPSLLLKNANKLFLKQGAGFSYRKIFIYEFINNALTKSEYETNLVDANSPNVVFFKNKEANDQLFLVNLDNKKIHLFAKLSSDHSNLEIKECQVFDSYIKVLFMNGSEVDLKLHNRDVN